MSDSFSPEETAYISFILLWDPHIKGQLINLPSHSQDTAAINFRIGQDLPCISSKGNVFGKQSDILFAEFLSRK